MSQASLTSTANSNCSQVKHRFHATVAEEKTLDFMRPGLTPALIAVCSGPVTSQTGAENPFRFRRPNRGGRYGDQLPFDSSRPGFDVGFRIIDWDLHFHVPEIHAPEPLDDV